MRDSDRRVRLAQAAGRAGVAGADLPNGCAVVGPPQSGRSTVLTALRERCGGDVVSLSGVGRTPQRVFGEVLGRPSTSDLRWDLAHAFAAMPDPTIVLDDADLLDDQAAAILHALVVHDRVPTYLTCVAETARRIPRGVSALWRDGHLPRFDLRALTLGEADEYVRVSLGGVPEIQDVADLFAQSGGRPAVFVELVQASIAAECWESVPGALLMVRQPPVTERVRGTLVGGDDLDAAEQAALVTLAAAAPDAAVHTGGWVPLSGILALHDLESLVDLERRGLVESHGRQVRLALPAVAETVRTQTPASVLTVATRKLGTSVSPVGLTGVEAAHAAVLAVVLTRRGGGPVGLDQVLAAARGALRLGDPETAVELLDAEPDLTAGHPVATALAANAVLHFADPTQFMTRMARCDVSEPLWSRLVAVTEDQIEWNSRGAVGYLRAHGATRDAVVAEVTREHGADPVVAAWRGLNCCVAAALQGKEQIARAALDVVLAEDFDDAFLSIYLECADLMMNVLIGDARDSGAAADRFLERHRWRSVRAREVIGFIAGLVYLEIGRIADADAQLGKGQRWWAVDDSGATPALAESLKTRRAAWRLAEADDLRGAAHLLDSAAAEAFDRGLYAAVAEYVELQLRFVIGRTDVDDDRIAVLSCGDGARARLVAAYARARNDDDPDALDDVGDRYASCGRLPVAADIAAQAASAHQRHGRRRASVASARVARDRVAQMAGFSSPAQQLAVLSATMLSRREHQVAELAATLSNRQIAEQLGLSVRTVEGHVLRACAKTGADDRAELSTFVKGTPSAPVGDPS